jgi:pyruvate formate lyase activating enzyme
MSVEEVLSIVLKDKNYYDNSNGGITISGGEPMAQYKFTYALAKEAKKQNLNVAIETSGFARTEDYRELSKYIDLFLFDYKATGDELHKKLTGVDRKLISENFHLLLSLNSKIILRCPIIPNYNLSEEHLKNIALIGNSSENIERVEILPYHNFGTGKAKQIGNVYNLDKAYMPEDKEIEGWINSLKSMGLNKVFRG